MSPTDEIGPTRDPPRKWRRDFTPARHLVAAVVAVVLFTALFALQVFLADLGRTGSGQALSEALAWAPLAGMVAGGAAIFPGLPLTVAAHLLLRRTSHEAVPVLVFGVVGGLTAIIAWWALGFRWSEAWIPTAAAAAATAAARFVVSRENVTWRGDQRTGLLPS